MGGTDSANQAGADGTVRICVNGEEVFSARRDEMPALKIEVVGDVGELQACANVIVDGNVENDIHAAGKIFDRSRPPHIVPRIGGDRGSDQFDQRIEIGLRAAALRVCTAMWAARIVENES